MPIISEITFGADQLGARLYRRTTQAVPGALATASYSTEYLCGFYPTAYASVWSQLGLVGNLDSTLFTLSPPLSESEKTLLIQSWNATQRVSTMGLWTYLCGNVVTPTTPTPSTEPAAVEPASPGWNAGAVSTKAFFRAGRVSFRAQVGKRAVVGLQEGPDPTDPASRCFGFNMALSAPYESGIRGWGNSATPALPPLTGSYVPTDDSTVYTVEILPSGVSWYVGNSLFGSMSLIDNNRIWSQPGVWSLGAAIYEPGAWVEGLEVVAYSGAELSLPALRGRAGKGTPFSGAQLALPRLIVQGRKATRAAMTLKGLRVRGSDYTLAEAYLALPALAMQATENFGAAGAPYAMLRMPKARMTASGKTGTVGRASLALHALKMRGTKGNIADAALALPPLRMFAADIPAGEGHLFSVGFGADHVAPYVEFAVVLNSTAGMAPVLVAGVVVPGEIAEAGQANTSMILSQVLTALMETEVSAGADTPSYDQAGETWVVGLDEKHPTSVFENFDFNSFGVIGGRTYGVKADGLYLLSGDTDAGEPIRASVSYGKQDFGTKTMKHMTRAYVGASSTGKLYLKIVADGKEYLYAARSSSAEIAQQRFDVGRGLQANYFTFELFNKDGGDFEIDSVSFFAAEFKRRI